MNAPANHQLCYNLRRDYDENGARKPDAVPFFKPAAGLSDLNKNACTNPDGLAELKRFIKDLRDELDECLQR